MHAEVRTEFRPWMLLHVGFPQVSSGTKRPLHITMTDAEVGQGAIVFCEARAGRCRFIKVALHPCLGMWKQGQAQHPVHLVYLGPPIFLHRGERDISLRNVGHSARRLGAMMP